MALNYIFSGALFAFQFDFNVLLASLTVWVNNTNCLTIHLHQKPPFSMIDTGGSANRTINVNLHSMDDSFRSLAPLPSLATARRRMCASRLDCHTTSGSFQRALSFSLRCCATLRSSESDSASGETCKIRTCDLYPFRLSDGFRPVPGSACPRLSRVSAPWPLERIV